MKETKLDYVDRTIIKMLGDDARTPLSEIAAELKLSRTTIRKRVNKLMKSEAFRIVLVPIYSKEFGGVLTLYLNGSIEEVVNFLKEQEACKQIYTNSEKEKNKIICVIFAESNESLGLIMSRIVQNSYIVNWDFSKISNIEKMI